MSNDLNLIMAYHSNDGYSGDERESRMGDDRPDSDLGDKPLYLLEHLATFTVNKETGIVYPADGMRRLLQLEKTTGIWSQKMQLCLDNQWVLIMDYETGNIIERFPASLIQQPTAFTSNDTMEMYNNILVFIVAGGSGLRSEMHIFQSQSISAVHLVEDLKQLRNGKLITKHRETIPMPSKMSGSHMMNSRNDRERDRDRDRDRDHYDGDRTSGLDVSNSGAADRIDRMDRMERSGGASMLAGGYQETDSELGVNDETSSTSSDKYERDVTVLNHCFDDIEKFIARLQHAAAASRELERRRRNRKSKKKDPGEGILTLRTRPPHEKEFIDIFAKFKLSFNLLAKLKAHIHDPNAPELVHFLFTPLALIVEASAETYYESHLPARAVNPLLTREAINLLINCVTSKETELWRSLGEAWTIPRDQWKGHSGSYHPVFFDGWSPDYPVVDELEHTVPISHIKRRVETHHNFSNALSGDYDFDSPPGPGEKYSDHPHPHPHPHSHSHQHPHPHHHQSPHGGGLRDFSAHSDISLDSIEHNSGPNMGNNGAPSILLNNPSANVQQTNSSTLQEQSTDAWIDDLQSRGAKIVQVTYPRTANNDKELTVVRGEYLEILDDTRKWWKARNSRGQVAHVPHTIVSPYNYNDNGDVFSNPLYTQKNVGRPMDTLPDRYTQSGGNTSPSPIMPAPNSADWVRNKHIGKKGEFRYF